MKIISRAAAYRILTQQIGKIIKFIKSLKQISKNVVQITYVTVNGTCSTFISLSKFKQDFVDLRKHNSQKLSVVRKSNTSFQVSNPEQETRYTIIPYSTGVDCDCEDYSNQIVKFGRGCCKHGYATLRVLGYQSLQQYLNSNYNTTAA